MSDFFPEPISPGSEPEVEDHPQPAWLNPPSDVLPGVVPVELIVGRSEQAVVMLTGFRAFPTGLAMVLHVRTRGPRGRIDLTGEVFDGPYRSDRGPEWQRDRLKWGFEYPDGTRATNVDPWHDRVDPDRPPNRPILSGGGGGGGDRNTDRDYWLWPLPTAGWLKVVCQWPQRHRADHQHDRCHADCNGCGQSPTHLVIGALVRSASCAHLRVHMNSDAAWHVVPDGIADAITSVTGSDGPGA